MPELIQSPPIIIAGSGRSGTTWIGNVVASCQRCIPVFEPLNPDRVPEVPAPINGSPFPGRYLRTNASHDDWQVFFQKLFSGDISNVWTRQDWTQIPKFAKGNFLLNRQAYRIARFCYWLRQLSANRLVLKMIRGNLLLSWLSREFPVRIVYLTRHPCAVIGSRLRHQWPHGLCGVLSQRDMAEDFLQPFVGIIEAAKNPLQQMTVLWCVENLVPITQAPCEEWLSIDYETFLKSPRDAFEFLIRDLGLLPTSSTGKAIEAIVSSPSKDSQRIKQWHEPLSCAEGQEVLRICSEFGLTKYANQAMPVQNCLASRALWS